MTTCIFCQHSMARHYFNRKKNVLSCEWHKRTERCSCEVNGTKEQKDVFVKRW